MAIFIKDFSRDILRAVFINRFFFYVSVRIKSEVLPFLFATLIVIKMFLLSILIVSRIFSFEYGIVVMSFQDQFTFRIEGTEFSILLSVNNI
jgi:hypothetical protein